MSNIVIISSHYPSTTLYPKLTRKTFEEYCNLHGYDYYFDESEPDEKEMYSLHYRRSYIVSNISDKYPNCEWFIWVDSDVFVQNKHISIESQIDLRDKNILYHLFHEAPWGCYPINTGVKIINKNAIIYEKEIWSIRNQDPWKNFPYEQKATYEYILPMIPGQYKIHDPYILNCIISAYPDKVNKALFTHMCGMKEEERDNYIVNFLK